MPKIIKNQSVIEDTWQLVESDQSLQVAGKIIVTKSLWESHKNTLTARNELGLLLLAEDEPESIANDLKYFKVIAIKFPSFADGRGYTIARLLRERFHYVGEIRAVGDVLQDQVFYMKRCGFDAFAIREDKNIEMALKSLNDFSQSYQGCIDEPLPLFKRR